MDNNENIILQNERSGHVEKLVNELSTFKFFQYVYSKDMFKVFGMNILMCIFLIPLIYIYYNFTLSTAAFNSSIPSNGSLGLGFTYWAGLTEYAANVLNGFSTKFWLYSIPSLCAFSLAFAGGICIIRDAFWTGRIKVFKPFFVGIYQCGLVVFVGFAFISSALFGLMQLNIFAASLPSFASVVLQIAAWIIFALVCIYLFMLFSVTATYKQDISASIKTAWTLMWKYFISTLVAFVMSLVPIFLLLIFGKGQLQIIMVVVLLMIGIFYIVLVWQAHMMKIFSIYHPVEKKVIKRKKQYQ